MAIGFLVFISISMYFYPGGNIHDDSQIGYSLTHNFLSDLGAYNAHNGEQNFLSSVFFAFSLGICFFAGLARPAKKQIPNEKAKKTDERKFCSPL